MLTISRLWTPLAKYKGVQVIHVLYCVMLVLKIVMACEVPGYNYVVYNLSQLYGILATESGVLLFLFL